MSQLITLEVSRQARRGATLFLLVSVISTLVSVTVSADSWRLPERKKYFSANKKYCLEVTPRKLESQLQYFQEKVDGKPKKEHNSDNICRAAFSIHSGGSRYQTKDSFALVNEVAPVDAIVSDSGKFFVTFDNWHSIGYGAGVVGIYQSNGKLIKSYSLEDLLTENDLSTFRLTVSSRHWGDGHYFDEINEHLVLRVVTKGKDVFNSDAVFRELKIDLKTGIPLLPKKDFLPREDIQIALEEVVSGNDSVSDTDQKEWECFSDSREILKNAKHLSSADLYSLISQKVEPVYPPIARAARATGTVSIAILITGTGQLACVHNPKGHPLLHNAVLTAVRKWEFTSPGNQPVTGIVNLNFRHVLIDPLKDDNK